MAGFVGNAKGREFLDGLRYQLATGGDLEEWGANYTGLWLELAAAREFRHSGPTVTAEDSGTEHIVGPPFELAGTLDGVGEGDKRQGKILLLGSRVSGYSTKRPGQRQELGGIVTVEGIALPEGVDPNASRLVTVVARLGERAASS